MIPLMLAEFACGFVGALLTYLIYYPHYQITPRVEAEHEEPHILLRSRHFRGQSSLHVSSCNSTSNKIPLISHHDLQIVLHKAVVNADQAAKLSTFANRPALRSTAWNFITEILCTFILVLGAEIWKTRLGVCQTKPVKYTNADCCPSCTVSTSSR
jgi:glycerol uptake facilitator-like aquaporin